MAVYVRHVLSTVGPKILQNSLKSSMIIPVRCSSHSKKVKKLPKRKIERVPIQSKVHSLASRGFLRNVDPYTPPQNSEEVIHKLFLDVVGTDDLQFVVNREQKFQLLSALSSEFSYTVPNSLLHRMTTLGYILEFYTTPVDNVTPFDHMQKIELPPNLHILYDYHRFHPDTDTMFDGVSAFPKSSTIVNGLKTKGKYKGYDAGNPFWDI